MVFKSKVQLGNKAGYKQYYATIPIKLAEAISLKEGSTIECEVKGKNKLGVKIT
jgi:antitoxin component of MazEF toxin-antitoxin module